MGKVYTTLKFNLQFNFILINYVLQKVNCLRTNLYSFLTYFGDKNLERKYKVWAKEITVFWELLRDSFPRNCLPVKIVVYSEIPVQKDL